MEKDLGDVINVLSSRGESGRLKISAGLNEGELFFDKGQLVDAHMGKLSGFQAINAISSLRGATFEFDPSITPPAQSSITANERLLLKDFFGIGTIRPEPAPDSDALFWPDDPVPPQQVVPLAEVQEPQHDELDARVNSGSTPRFVNNESLWADPSTTAASATKNDNELLDASEGKLPPQPFDANKDANKVERETTLVDDNAPLQRAPVLDSGFQRRAALAVLLIIIVAAIALALAYRSRRDSSPSVASAVQTSAPIQTASPIDTSVPAQVQPVAKDDIAKNDREVNAPDLSGNWTIINTVEKTSYQSFKNMQVGFNLAINQSGKEFTGRGEKISENGHSLPGASRTPILVKGSIDGNRVEASFSEQGEARKSSGHFVWRIDKRGGLNGRFVSTAARASGKSAAKKQS